MNIIYLEINGTRYEGWTDIKVTKSIENFCGSFSFSSGPLQNKEGKNIPFPIKRYQPCKIYIDETLIINGWIEKITVQLTEDNTHIITVEGRDRTNDVVDSQLSQELNFKAPITLKQIVEKVLQKINLSHIKVIDPYNLKSFTDIKTAGLGTTAFDFIEPYAKKRQVLLTTNGDGNIVFQRASNIKIDAILTTDKNNIGTIKNSTVIYDETKRFHFYGVHGQVSISASLDKFGQKREPKKIVNIAGNARDNEIRNSRELYFQPDENGDDDDVVDTAIWEANFRRAQAMVYSCTVQGYYPFQQSEIWRPNRLIRIKDDDADIDSILLISDIVYEKTLDRGTLTTLKLLTKDAFTLQSNRSKKDKKDNKEGYDTFGVKKET